MPTVRAGRAGDVVGRLRLRHLDREGLEIAVALAVGHERVDGELSYLPVMWLPPKDPAAIVPGVAVASMDAVPVEAGDPSPQSSVNEYVVDVVATALKVGATVKVVPKVTALAADRVEGRARR